MLLQNRSVCVIIHTLQKSNAVKYAEISKWGRLRPPPVADEGSKKEWQRSKFCEANSEQKISGTATGHNGADSKGSRAYHSRERKISRFLRFPRKCFIFLEFWMTAFQLRPCKSRAKFKLNLIRRDIEVVITGLTRNLLR